MAITFVATANGGTGSSTSFSITFPGAVQVGDLLILEYVHRGTNDGTLGSDGGSGWARKHKQFFGTGSPQDFCGQTYWKIATGNDVSSPARTVTCTGLVNSCAAILTVYRGAGAVGSPTEPLNEAAVVGEENASANETQAEITTSRANAWVVLVVVNSPDLDVSSGACTDPGALTERSEALSTAGTDTSISHWSAEKVTAGGTGAFTWSQTNAASGSWAYAITPFVAERIATSALLEAPDTASGSAELFPTTAVLDPFTDTNGTSLTAHNAKWILDGGNTVAQVQSNQATLNAAAVFTAYTWNDNFGPGCEGRINFNTGTGTNRYVNLVLRATQSDPSTTGGYLVEVWDNDTSTFVQLNFYRIDNGVNTLLNTQAISLADSTNYQLGLRSVGSTHTIYLNGQKFSIEDSTYLGAGFPQLYFGQTTGTPLTLDDFGAGTLGEFLGPHIPGKIARLSQFGVGSRDYVGFVAKSGGVTTRTADAALLEQADALASAVQVSLLVTASLAESADTVVSTGTALVTGAASIIERGDFLSATLATTVSVSASLMEATDSLSSATTVLILGTAANIERADTLAANGVSGIGANAAITERPDTVASAIAVSIAATLSVLEAADSLTSAVSGALNAVALLTEQADSLTSASTVAVVANAALVEAADALISDVTTISEGQHTPGRIGRLAQFGVGTKDYAGFVAKANDSQAERFATVALIEQGDFLTASASAATVHEPGHITRLGQFAIGLTKQATFGPKTGSREATAALIEESDALSSAVQTSRLAAASLVELPDQLTAATLVALVGTASLTERADTSTAAATVAIVATASLVEYGDTLSSGGGAAVFAQLDATERADTATSAGAVLVTGTAAATEASDSTTSGVAVAVTGAATALETPDQLVSVTAVTVTAAASALERGDTLDSNGGAATFANASMTESADSATSVGVVLVTGTFNVLEAADTLASSVALISGATGTAAILEAADIVVANGSVLVLASLAASEQGDASSASVAVVVTGSAATAEAGDTLVADGVAAMRVIAADLREQDDTLSATVIGGFAARVRGRDAKRHRALATDGKRHRITGGDGV